MTEDMTANIALYHNLFLVCLILFFLCLAVTVVLFFFLDIADVIAYLTGRKAKKQIQQLEKEDVKSGPLKMEEQKSVQYMSESKPREVTQKLDENQKEVSHQPQKAAGTFEIEREIILIHTEEMI